MRFHRCVGCSCAECRMHACSDRISASARALLSCKLSCCFFICICRPPAVPCCCCAPASFRSSCITTPPVHVWHSVRQRVGHPGSLTGCVLESRLLWRRIPCFPPLMSCLSNLLLLPLPYTHARPLMLVLRARTLMRKGVVADYAARSEYWVVFHHRGNQQRVSAA